MEFSIVMPCLLKDEAHREVVRDTVMSVKASDKDFEFIVVDDGSPLSTGFLKNEADVYIKHNGGNKGIAPSWNDGKNVSRGEYIVIVNDDIRVPDGWLREMAKVFENEKVGAVGTKIAGPTVNPEISGRPRPNHKWFSGYCFMLKRDRFIEDFDEQFVPFNFEDIDYWERIQEAGLELWKSPVAIWHAEGDTIHSMSYNEIDRENLQKFMSKWGFNPKDKYFGR